MRIEFLVKKLILQEYLEILYNLILAKVKTYNFYELVF